MHSPNSPTPCPYLEVRVGLQPGVWFGGGTGWGTGEGVATSSQLSERDWQLDNMAGVRQQATGDGGREGGEWCPFALPPMFLFLPPV